MPSLPTLLPSEPLVEKREDLGHVEPDVFQVEVVQFVLLHLQEVIELQVELKKAALASSGAVSN